MRTIKNKRGSKTPQSPFNKAIKFLSFRNRSVKEINDYLKKKGFFENEINETIEKLIEFKFIDDTKFSELFIRNRQLKGRSKKMISYELKIKGINREIIEESLEFSQNDLKTAKEYIEKRLHQFERFTSEEKSRKIISRLRSRGYNWDVIKEILKEINIIS